MVYNYLLVLYKHLELRRREIDQALSRTEPDTEEAQHWAGRRQVIDEFTLFLQENYHRKLPRRIQKDPSYSPK